MSAWRPCRRTSSARHRSGRLLRCALAWARTSRPKTGSIASESLASGPGAARYPPGRVSIQEEPAMATPTLERLKPERLSLVDTAWLRMEMPTNLMMVGSLAFFDTPVDRGQLLTALDRRLLIHPRFRERIEAARLGPPRWVPDAMFDLNDHVHRIALPAPSGEVELR